MLIKSLHLQNFRSHARARWDFDEGTTIIVGRNAAGKTNMLEAIYLLASGKSFRQGEAEDMIAYNQAIGRAACLVKNIKGEEKLEAVLTRGEVGGQAVPKKKYLVNGLAKRLVDFAGNLRAVYFGPEDLEIITDSPSLRRDWLDDVLRQTNWEYRRASLSYYKSLRQRNKLLEQVRDGDRPASSLFLWDRLLIENGGKITEWREKFIDFVNNQPDYFWQTDGKSLPTGVYEGDLRLFYDRSVISPQRLQQYAVQEIAAAATLVGPHRDDFRIEVVVGNQDRDLRIFGSRGEQRTAVFSLKMAQLEFLSSETSERPILLLDDVFSELDEFHRQRLLEIVPKQQTIITTTDLDLVDKKYLRECQVVRLGEQ